MVPIAYLSRGSRASLRDDALSLDRCVVDREADLRKHERDRGLGGAARSELRLTPRERQILERVKRGLDNRRIAEELGIATQSVKDHVSVLLSKFGVKNRSGLTRIATHMDLVGEAAVPGRFLRMLFTDAPLGIALLSGPDLRFTIVNEALRRLVGGREFVGRTWREAMPETSDRYESTLRRVYATGEPLVRREVAATWDAGSGIRTRSVDAIAVRLAGESGEADGVVLFVMDVTEHVRSRGQVAEPTKTRDVPADLVSHGVVIVDPSRRVIMRNALGRAIGSRDHPVVDADLMRERGVRVATTGEPIHPDDDPISRALHGEATPGQEYLYRVPTTGQELRLWGSVQPLRDADGDVRAALIVFDILGA